LKHNKFIHVVPVTLGYTTLALSTRKELNLKTFRNKDRT